MRIGRSLAISFATLVAAAVLPGACGTDGLVGGTCGKGLSNCANHCVNLKTDRKNCGHCGHVCASGVACIDGLCGGGGEAGWGGDEPNAGSANHGRYSGGASGRGSGAAAGDFGEFDAGDPRGGAGGSSGNVGGTGNPASDGGSTNDAGYVCTPPYDTAAHCGTCNTVCVEPTRVCAPVDGKYACVPFCDAPLVECSGACVDLQSDSNNCGSCGVACPSAICQGGVCIGARAGHIVAICMDYSVTAQNSQPTKLLGNAVFLPLSNPVKILAYDEFANPNVRARVDTTIAWAALGRTYLPPTYVSQSEAVNAQLKKPDYDVFLVYDQPLAPAGTLSTYGSQWAKTLESFSHVGGVIIVLDGATGVKEMGQFLTSARLLEVTKESAVSGSWVYNRQEGDIIGNYVVSPFLAPQNSCVFTTPAPKDSMSIFVVTDDASPVSAQRPVVVHRITIPPVK
jgi:hypothetical protein